MRRPAPLAVASAVSLSMTLAMAAIWIETYDLKPTPGSFSRCEPDGILLAGDIRILAFNGDFSIYNWDVPDRGDITWFGNDPKQTALLDLAGIYFVEFKSTKLFRSGAFWTLTIPFLH